MAARGWGEGRVCVSFGGDDAHILELESGDDCTILNI